MPQRMKRTISILLKKIYHPKDKIDKLLLDFYTASTSWLNGTKWWDRIYFEFGSRDCWQAILLNFLIKLRRLLGSSINKVKTWLQKITLSFSNIRYYNTNFHPLNIISNPTLKYFGCNMIDSASVTNIPCAHGFK